MQKNYFLFLIFFTFSFADAQIINFPDYYVKAKLLQADSYSPYLIAKNEGGVFFKIDSNNDGQIDVTEALRVSYLDLSSYGLNNLDGLNNFPNLKELVCRNNSLTNIDLTELPNLEKIDCSTNRLTSLDLKVQVKITELVCDHNQLTSIVINDKNVLAKLICYSNRLSFLNLNNVSQLKELDCSGNNFTMLDFSALTELTTLDFSYNTIATIDLKSLSNLELLNFGSNRLKSVDLSSNLKLKALNFEYNQFENIDIRNLTNLTSLYFTGNFISTIDLENNRLLKTIYCVGNKITSLDLSNQVKLTDLYCYDNLLTTLDLSQCKNLFSLNCSNNPLTFLNLKNGANAMFSASGTNLKFLCTDDDSYAQYNAENHLRLSNISNCIVNSYCSFNPGGTYYTISGNQKYDSDNNGCDISDTKLPNLNFNITDGTLKGNIISDESGNYSISVGEGTHTITPILEDPNYYEVSPESLVVTFPTQTSPFTQNFCVTPKGEHQDIEITILSTVPARPGFDATYKIVYKNKANKTVSGSVTLDFNDAVLDYVAASPSITNQTTNKLVWDYTNLKALETREINVTLNVNSPMENPAVNINDRLSFNALITPVTGDEKPVDNSFALRQTVVGSFDPNDKTCLEGDVITPELIGEYVHYLIRFENTGTYPAENIVVKDMIDLSKFDISTLVPTSASHSYTTKISEGNRVEFIFEKINLPFNDAHNDGYIAFKIKTLPTLKTGDSFTNEANIYFDYNFPILTNKATSTFKTLGTQDFEFAKYFTIYPNPAQNVLNISIKNDIIIKSLAIYDILGQLVIAVPNAENVSTIDVSKLRTGNYILKIKTDNGTSGVKFIKL
ncbi:MAG: leucine-rich repeat domain-containing protein [Flavobacterium circumlabens]|uniref:T9SS type A sorting domain-containing protein n=1 Tax=Flavobacterium circumlabens TaxID=2133765 RepID=UPI0032655622